MHHLTKYGVACRCSKYVFPGGRASGSVFVTIGAFFGPWSARMTLSPVSPATAAAVRVTIVERSRIEWNRAEKRRWSNLDCANPFLANKCRGPKPRFLVCALPLVLRDYLAKRNAFVFIARTVLWLSSCSMLARHLFRSRLAFLRVETEEIVVADVKLCCIGLGNATDATSAAPVP